MFALSLRNSTWRDTQFWFWPGKRHRPHKSKTSICVSKLRGPVWAQ